MRIGHQFGFNVDRPAIGIAGLIADWDARVGVTTSSGNVTSWADAIGGLSVVNVGSGPAFNLTGGPGGNSPSLTFSLGNYLHNSAVDLLPHGNDRTIFAVGKRAAATNKGLLLQFSLSNTSAKFGLIDLGTSVYYIYSDGVAVNETTASEPSVSAYSIFDITYSIGATSVVRINEAAQVISGGPVANAESGVTGFSIGQSPDPTFPFNWAGDVCRVLVYNRVLTAGETITVENSLKADYGL